MPVHVSYPGVYVEEIPSGVRTITGVATSITAFIGRALRGPVNEATVINSYADYERIFGGLWIHSSLSFAVRDFYLNGGSQAVIVRLFHPSFANEAERLKADGAALAVVAVVNGAADSADAVTKAQAVVAGLSTEPEKTAAAKISAVVKRKADGLLPELRSAADVAAAKFLAAAEVLAARAVATAVHAAADATAAVTAASDEAKKFTTDPGKSAAAAVAKAVEDQPQISFGKLKTDAAEAVASAAPHTKASVTAGGLTVQAANEGTWGANLRLEIDDEVSEDLATVWGLAKADLFNVTVRDDAPNGRSERHLNLTVKPSPRRVDGVLEDESKLVRCKLDPNNLPTIVKGKDAVTVAADELRERNQGGNPAEIKAAKVKLENARQALRATASDGDPLTVADFVPQGGQANKKGLFALEQVDLFNLLCIPPYTSTGNVEPPVLAAAVVYCEDRRAMLIADSPPQWKDPAAAIKGFQEGAFSILRSRNAALYFPRLLQENPLNRNAIEEFAPCGAVAGIFARTDTERGVWKAPAGTEATIVGARGFSVPLTDLENGQLNPLGINCLRAFPAAGRVVWGARTTRGNDQLADEYKYIPVRRLALYIEESLYRGTQWVVFEPNDEPLWAQIRLNVGAFMHTLFRQGAFQGASPRDAYFVKCDKETTIQTDINLGIVNIIVGFAPLKPAEFVIIKLQQMAGQIET